MYTIEEESGTLSGSPRQHNGYYAGDFSNVPIKVLPIDLPRAA